jgi:citrate lyase subunit beta/citryl-CoA lyase
VSDPVFTARSLLFVPGTRPDMLAKVARCGPDAVVVDLEDAVAPAAKEEARALAVQAVAAERPGAGMVLLRVNPAGTPWHQADVAAAAAVGFDGVVLPKYEDGAQLAEVRAALAPAARVVVGLESARGVADCRALLDHGPHGVYFGAEDFVADLGGHRTAAGTEVLYARSQVCLAAHVAGVAALDQAVVAVRDEAAFRADAEQGRAIGYQGKICLHPSQVLLAHEVFTPTEAEIAHARAVLAAGREGVGVVDGQMVDAVHLRMAQTVLARAGEAG